MAERRADSHRGGGHTVFADVVLPVGLLFMVVALLAGLVFGGVIQGKAARVGPGGPTTTQPTILIEP